MATKFPSLHSNIMRWHHDNPDASSVGQLRKALPHIHRSQATLARRSATGSWWPSIGQRRDCRRSVVASTAPVIRTRTRPRTQSRSTCRSQRVPLKRVVLAQRRPQQNGFRRPAGRGPRPQGSRACLPPPNGVQIRVDFMSARDLDNTGRGRQTLLHDPKRLGGGPSRLPLRTGQNRNCRYVCPFAC
jgi:hypothetical protein